MAAERLCGSYSCRLQQEMGRAGCFCPACNHVATTLDDWRAGRGGALPLRPLPVSAEPTLEAVALIVTRTERRCAAFPSEHAQHAEWRLSAYQAIASALATLEVLSDR